MSAASGEVVVHVHVELPEGLATALALLAAERARLRRWQLRLRWRASTTTPDWHDRLALRAWRFPFGGAMLGDSNWRRYPIAGPRGVLP